MFRTPGKLGALPVRSAQWLGGLRHAVFIASARRDGGLKAEGYAGLRVACWAAAAWLAAVPGADADPN